MARITVVGGSSPYTIELIRDLRKGIASQHSGHLVLHGRDPDSLHAVSLFAENQLAPLGWSVEFTTSLLQAVQSSDIILHQIRYGDLALRKHGEIFCETCGCIADETLGPASLMAGIVSYEPLKQTCKIFVNHAPNATVINLTNPLSVSTSLMHKFGVKKVIGVCELPLTTARLAADSLELPVSDLNWKYTGLNHRGFIHGMQHGSSDVLPMLVNSLASDPSTAAFAKYVEQLHALPTKYFSLFSENTRLQSNQKTGSRADFLIKLRTDIFSELKMNPTTYPENLSRRDLSWYPDAVLPILSALINSSDEIVAMNVVNKATGITHEIVGNLNQISNSSPTLYCGKPVVDHWLHRYYEHEQAMLSELSSEPDSAWIEHCFSLDPSIHFPVQAMSRNFITYINQLPYYQSQQSQ